jgi:hypothetical protein
MARKTHGGRCERHPIKDVDFTKYRLDRIEFTNSSLPAEVRIFFFEVDGAKHPTACYITIKWLRSQSECTYRETCEGGKRNTNILHTREDEGSYRIEGRPISEAEAPTPEGKVITHPS